MKKLALALVGTCSALVAVAAPKAVPASEPTPYFVANCFNCHGTDGKTGGAIPSLAGRDKPFLEEALKGYKNGTRPATIMHQLTKGYTDEEITILADYFAKQK